MSKSKSGAGPLVPSETEVDGHVGAGHGAGHLEITYRDTNDLIPYARNSRTHSEAQVAQIAASIREFGWTNPILIDDAGTIVAGHGRLLAAQKLRMGRVPTILLEGLTETQRRALIIADNKLALNAGWDDEMLLLELQDLAADGVDLEVLGFSEMELADLFADPTSGLTDPDEIPEVPDEPLSVLGDVWKLGRHRIACGSCTEAHTVEAVLAGVTPHLMVTDPPYGVNYDPSWRVNAKRADGKALSTGRVATGEVLNDDRADWTEAWALFPGDVAYVWHGALHSAAVAASLESVGLLVRSQIIWNKPRFTIGRGDYHWKHEPCWYVVRKGKPGQWAGDRKQSTIWDIEKNDGANPDREEATIHGTQKPVECMERPILNNSSPGQAVYEPFSGSGTTIIAGEKSGRAVHAIELNPAYVDVAILRWQAFTGQTAVLESTGQTFTEVLVERLPGAVLKPVHGAEKKSKAKAKANG